MLKGRIWGFITLVFVSSFLLLSNQIGASETFDSKYGVKIVSSNNSMRPPSINCDFWTATTSIEFDNGLTGYSTTEWSHESQAKEMTQRKPPTGNVNLLVSSVRERTTFKVLNATFKIFSPTFELISDKASYSTYAVLCVFKEYRSKVLDKNPRIVSFTEDTEVIPGWFYESYQYRYIVKLNDGRSFVTEKSSEKLPPSQFDAWKSGCRIIVVGNSASTCLINIDSVQNTSIKPENCLSCNELVSSSV